MPQSGWDSFGEEAKLAIPELQAAQRDKDARVRRAAGVALSRIESEPHTEDRALQAARQMTGGVDNRPSDFPGRRRWSKRAARSIMAQCPFTHAEPIGAECLVATRGHPLHLPRRCFTFMSRPANLAELRASGWVSRSVKRQYARQLPPHAQRRRRVVPRHRRRPTTRSFRK